MGSEVIVIPIIFGVLFGIVYLFISARNRERLALIEKGADASIFYSRDTRTLSTWKVVVINLALLSMGIGLGIFIAALMVQSGMDHEVAYPGTIFFMAGLGLLSGFFLVKKLNKEEV